MSMPAKSKYGGKANGGVTGLGCIEKRLRFRLGRTHQPHDRGMAQKSILVVVLSDHREEWFHGLGGFQLSHGDGGMKTDA